MRGAVQFLFFFLLGDERVACLHGMISSLRNEAGLHDVGRACRNAASGGLAMLQAVFLHMSC